MRVCVCCVSQVSVSFQPKHLTITITDPANPDDEYKLDLDLYGEVRTDTHTHTYAHQRTHPLPTHTPHTDSDITVGRMPVRICVCLCVCVCVCVCTQVLPDQCRYEVLKTKVEVVLVKADSAVQWVSEGHVTHTCTHARWHRQSHAVQWGQRWMAATP